MRAGPVLSHVSHENWELVRMNAPKKGLTYTQTAKRETDIPSFHGGRDCGNRNH
jgi:hypothetical protein